jgi:hypothetical protein
MFLKKKKNSPHASHASPTSRRPAARQRWLGTTERRHPPAARLLLPLPPPVSHRSSLAARLRQLSGFYFFLRYCASIEGTYASTSLSGFYFGRLIPYLLVLWLVLVPPPICTDKLVVDAKCWFYYFRRGGYFFGINAYAIFLNRIWP